MTKITRDKVLKKVQALEKYLGKGGQAIIAQKLGIDSKSIRRIKQGTRSGISYYSKLDHLLKNKYLLSFDLELKDKKRTLETSRKYLKYHQSKPKNSYRKQKIKEWKQLKRAYIRDLHISEIKRKYELEDIRYYKGIKDKKIKKSKKAETRKKEYEVRLLELRKLGTPRWFYDTSGYKHRILLVYNHFSVDDLDKFVDFWSELFERAARNEKFILYMGKTPAIIDSLQSLETFMVVWEKWLDSIFDLVENGIKDLNVITGEFLGIRRKVSEAEKKKLTAEDLRMQM